MTSGTIWLGTAAPADASDLPGAAHCVLISLRVESFRWKRVSQATFGKKTPAGALMSRPLSQFKSRGSLIQQALSLPSSFVREHLACGGAIGFHDVGMHTSASATGSALPATGGLDNDPRAGRPCRPNAPLAAAVTSSFLVPLSLPSNPFALFYYEGQHNGAFFMSHWFLSAMTGNLSSSRLTCVFLFLSSAVGRGKDLFLVVLIGADS